MSHPEIPPGHEKFVFGSDFPNGVTPLFYHFYASQDQVKIDELSKVERHLCAGAMILLWLEEADRMRVENTYSYVDSYFGDVRNRMDAAPAMEMLHCEANAEAWRRWAKMKEDA